MRSLFGYKKIHEIQDEKKEQNPKYVDKLQGQKDKIWVPLVEDVVCDPRGEGCSTALLAVSTTGELSILVLAFTVQLGTRTTNNL